MKEEGQLDCEPNGMVGSRRQPVFGAKGEATHAKDHVRWLGLRGGKVHNWNSRCDMSFSTIGIIVKYLESSLAPDWG